MGFKQKIYLSLTILLILGYSIFTVISYQGSKKIMKNSIEQNLSAAARSNAEYVQEWMDVKLQILDGTSMVISSGDIDNEKGLLVVLESAMKSTRAMAVFYGLEDGYFLDGSGWNAPDDFDSRTRPWYKTTKNARGAVITDVYMDLAENKLVTSLAVPIEKSGAFDGVLAASIELTDFVAKTREMVLEGGFFAFLDNHGLLIGHPDEKLVGKKFSEVYPEIQWLEKEIYGKERGIIEYKEKDTPKIMVFDTVAKTGWKTVAFVDRDFVYSDIYAGLKRFAITSVVAIVVTILLMAYCLFVLFKPLNKLDAMIKDLAKGEGDLTKRVEIDGTDEIAQIGGNVNVFIEKIQNIIKKFVGNTENVDTTSHLLTDMATSLSSGSQEMTGRFDSVARESQNMEQNMTHVAEAMEKSTANISMVAGSVEEMNSTVAQIAENIERAVATSHSGVQQAKDTAEKMMELDQSAKAIGTVTETITEISEKTNLLALNATIEAARAGEAGKSFAIVANEIKELAQQTAQATGNIKGQIEDIQRTSTSSIQSIGEILEIIDNVNEEINLISTAVDEQAVASRSIADNIAQASIQLNEVNENVSIGSTVSGTINEEISQVTKVSDKIATTSGDLTSHAGRLRELSSELKTVLDTFQV